jgi:hypothetical protein
MREIAIALAAFAAVGIAMSLITSDATAQRADVVVRSDRDHDRGLHRGWRNHQKIVIIKYRGHRDRDSD